ncbi:hypothetical protein M885DRAFT_548027 [Pelagophyceae sp. CCMP2097]|nr:hypothetical protein M885DRAFT_548027 [Pelagophyceae sp. CCMP2097]
MRRRCCAVAAEPKGPGRCRGRAEHRCRRAERRRGAAEQGRRRKRPRRGVTSRRQQLGIAAPPEVPPEQVRPQLGRGLGHDLLHRPPLQALVQATALTQISRGPASGGRLFIQEAVAAAAVAVAGGEVRALHEPGLVVADVLRLAPLNRTSKVPVCDALVVGPPGHAPSKVVDPVPILVVARVEDSDSAAAAVEVALAGEAELAGASRHDAVLDAQERVRGESRDVGGVGSEGSGHLGGVDPPRSDADRRGDVGGTADDPDALASERDVLFYRAHGEARVVLLLELAVQVGPRLAPADGDEQVVGLVHVVEVLRQVFRDVQLVLEDVLHVGRLLEGDAPCASIHGRRRVVDDEDLCLEVGPLADGREPGDQHVVDLGAVTLAVGERRVPGSAADHLALALRKVERAPVGAVAVAADAAQLRPAPGAPLLEDTGERREKRLGHNGAEAKAVDVAGLAEGLDAVYELFPEEEIRARLGETHLARLVQAAPRLVGREADDLLPPGLGRGVVPLGAARERLGAGGGDLVGAVCGALTNHPVVVERARERRAEDHPLRASGGIRESVTGLTWAKTLPQHWHLERALTRGIGRPSPSMTTVGAPVCVECFAGTESHLPSRPKQAGFAHGTEGWPQSPR